MESFTGKLAVVTGGGSGIGRALVIRLAAEGCSVAVCDLNAAPAAETVALALAGAPAGVRVTAHVADVADEASLVAARDEIAVQHGTAHLNLLFNNAGVAGAGSFVADDREMWERVFAICWGGVYLGCRTFLPMLVASEEAVIVNTSSINAVWPKHGTAVPSTAYGAAKYAVKGFSEALIEDLRTHAVGVAVVMPGSVTTNLGANSTSVIGAYDWTSAIPDLRARLLAQGARVETATEEQLGRIEKAFMPALRAFGYLMTPEYAADEVLRAVRAGSWRIVVGTDAELLDRLVRADPEHALDAGGTALTPQWLVTLVTLAVLLRPEAIEGMTADLAFRFDADAPVGVHVEDGELTFYAAPAPSPTASLVMSPSVLRALVLRERTVDDAVRAGDLEIVGDRQAASRLLSAGTPPGATQ